MPSALSSEHDDPVIASYNVYITDPSSSDTQTSDSSGDSKLFVLQYPAHRSLLKPYNAARSQKPNVLRYKPQTGMMEVDIPMLTGEYFNEDTGKKYGQALTDSRLSQMGGTHGLAGGFVSGPANVQTLNLQDIPAHGVMENRPLDTQTLGGKVISASPRDPLYMIGSLRGGELHLTHLDAVVQLRPQLHHIDAEDEINQKRFQSSTGNLGKTKPGFEAPPSKLESKAIELKMKDSKEDPKDKSLNTNAQILRKIQAEQWKRYEWIDEDDGVIQNKADNRVFLDLSRPDHQPKQLKSMLSNDDWLDKMSVPREDGRKGLRAKLKGRDRERARRKRVEHQRRQNEPGTAATNDRINVSSDSDVSSASEQSDAEVVDKSKDLGEADIKQESASFAAAPAAVPSVPDPAPVSAAPKRRGRPKKT